MQNGLTRRIPIRRGPRPTDGRRPRLGTAAREHEFVSLPFPGAVAGDYTKTSDRALGEDVGAGRNLSRGVRGVGDVVKRPAFTVLKIVPEELIVVGGE